MGTTVTAAAETGALALDTGVVAAWLVTIVVLLVVGALFWLLLRRSSAGRAPLAVDRVRAEEAGAADPASGTGGTASGSDDPGPGPTAAPE